MFYNLPLAIRDLRELTPVSVGEYTASSNRGGCGSSVFQGFLVHGANVLIPR